MNPTPEDFVAELQRLRPRRPSPAVTERLDRALDGRPAGGGRWRGSGMATPAWWTVGLAAAAALAIGLWVVRQPADPARPLADWANAPQPASRGATVTPAGSGADWALRQVERANYLLSAEDDGLIYVSDDLPLRTIRCRYVDTSRWRNERENLTVDLYVPRDGMVLLPVQIY